MTCTFSNEFYLFGTYFVGAQTVSGTKYQDWHKRSDLTEEGELNDKVHPIPLTPIMVNALSGDGDPELWGTNNVGKIFNLSLGEPLAAPESDIRTGDKVVKDNAAVLDYEEYTILRHSDRCEVIHPETDYQISFPPLSWLSQMVAAPNSDHGAATVGQLAENLKEFAQIIDSANEGSEKQIGEPFRLTKILPSQLAPKYEPQTGEQLTEQQKAYNDWREAKLLKPDEPIQGFMVPHMHTCAVLFSDPLYAGAEVTLVKPIVSLDADGIESTCEEVLATTTIDHFEPDWLKEEGPKTLPSAIFNFDPTAVDDGLYLIRISFWQREWEEFHADKGLVLPKSVKQANIKREIKDRSKNDRSQNVYTYELHEKVVFKPSPGIGKVACICGDMITLEELLIQQFPLQLPSYQDYTTKGLTYNASTRAGIAPLSLACTIKKTYDSLNDDFVSIDGLKAKGNAGQIATTLGMALWDNAEKEQIPKFVTSGLALNAALSAKKEALQQLKKANIFARRGLSFERSTQLLFKKNVLDLSYIKRQFNNNGSINLTRGLGRLANSWINGNLVNRGLPMIGVVNGSKDVLEQYKEYSKAVESAESAQKDMQTLSADYLKQLTYLTKGETKKSWQDSAKAIQNSLGNNAIIVQDKHGIAVRLHFQFNSALIENQIDSLNSDFSSVCNKLTILLEENPSYQIVIEGHAGQIGSHENNLTVSKERAEFVQKELLKNAEDPEQLSSRLITVSHGNTRPIDLEYIGIKDTSDESAYAPDRRVDIRLVVPDFSVTLPPSRIGAQRLNSYHQLWEGHMLDAKDAQTELFMSATDVLSAVAIFTPMAPAAAYFALGRAGIELCGSATELYDDITGSQTFNQFKEHYKSKQDLATLSMINQKLLSRYTEINKPIEVKVVDAADLAEHIEGQVTANELLKRYLLRAYALNSLVELLAIISNKSSDLTALVARYRVGEFIEQYVMTDNWELASRSGNSLAQNWANRYCTHSNFHGSDHTLLHRSGGVNWGARVSGAFNTGFPVQTALYHDVAEKALEGFCKDFDLTSTKLSKGEIAFSRMLVEGDDGKWHSYVDWRNKDRDRRIGPQTRIKLQLILNKEASSKHKSAFTQTIKYRAVIPGFDVYGPEYDVLFISKELREFTKPEGCSELDDYFNGELLLTGVEFEPSFWFGAHHISGIKPLCAATWYEKAKAFFSRQSPFEYLKNNGSFEQLPYMFSVGEQDISIGKLYHLSRTFDCYAFRYGIKEIERETQCYDGRHDVTMSLNDQDFLIEEFVLSGSSQARGSTPPVVHGNVLSLTGIQVGDDRRWLDDWSALDMLNSFDWSKEQTFSLYFTLLGDSTAHAAYESMGLNANEVFMNVSLVDGPTMHSEMYYSGVVNIQETKANMPDKDSYNGTTVKSSFKLSHETTLTDELAQISDEAMRYIEEVGEAHISKLTGKREKHLYVVKFDFTYVAPTGKKVEGLRPFGNIINGDGLKSLMLKSTQLSHSDINESYDVPKISIRLPSSNSFSHDTPWVKDIDDKNSENLSATRHWRELESDKRQKWTKEWIEDHGSSSKAPEVKLIQI
ncbi:OmpA family protein [Vibrio lamellibrachiae]|uniref:OmpA family protein n=1 Tax=Vibrio lamellibrachiae TaxID=2910253 RepID=UPI003D0BE9BA